MQLFITPLCCINVHLAYLNQHKFYKFRGFAGPDHGKPSLKHCQFKESRATVQPEGYCYSWPHRAEPQALSWCVVLPPSATMWGVPGAFCKAAVEMKPLSECEPFSCTESTVSPF